jgi:hypothetical protein
MCYRVLLFAALPGFLCEFADARCSLPDQGVEKQQPAKEPDAAAIAKLVKQLENPKFTEREEATKALQAIGVPALAALRKVAQSGDLEAAQRATRLIKAIESSLDTLLADYRAYGLPLPPPDAKLVRFVSSYQMNKGKVVPINYALGFLLRPGTKDNPPLLLVGTEEYSLRWPDEVVAVEPRMNLVNTGDLYWSDRLDFAMNTGLVVALQFKARGWGSLAEELWTWSIQKAEGNPKGAFYQPANLPPRTAVSYLAWAFSANELLIPGSDRTKTAKRIRAVFAAEPDLNTAANRAFLESVESALVPSTAKPGTVERLIDDLTEMSDPDREKTEVDLHYSRLATLGFAAVPALLEHLADDRLTRRLQMFGAGGSGPGPHIPPRSFHLKVGDVVSKLLRALAGMALGTIWDGRVKKADALAWWDEARKMGEEAYLMKHILPAGKSVWPNSHLLDILTAKYSQHLPIVYKTILEERPEISSFDVAEAIAKSSLPDSKKIALFLDATYHKDLNHRRAGLLDLQKLDPAQFLKRLLATLESLPKTPKEPYRHSPEAMLAPAVIATDNPEAWKMLEKVAKRSDVSLRMAFLDTMVGRYRDEQRKQRLEFLAAFLDDAETPSKQEDPKMFLFLHPDGGLNTGNSIYQTEVRNFAASRIAAILELGVQPSSDRTLADWEKLRNQLKERLKK